MKAPFGASGQKNQRIDPGDPISNWVQRTISSQGCVIVEPYFDRVLDFSVQYQARRRTVCAYSDSFAWKTPLAGNSPRQLRARNLLRTFLRIVPIQSVDGIATNQLYRVRFANPSSKH